MEIKRARLLVWIAFILVLAVSLPQVIRHYIWLLGGEGFRLILKSRWDIVAVNVILFLVFLLLIPFRTQTSWRTKGIYSAFIIALFAEMYGFPLTTYLLANYVGTIKTDYTPQPILDFTFMGAHLAMTYTMILGATITTIGLALIVLGWIQVHKSKGKPVTTGIYKYSRHPQYVGILLVTFGWLIHWPTIPTLVMWPILAISYHRLAKKEEEYMLKQKEYKKYKEKTPMYL